MAEPSHQHTMAGPPLDAKRAESSREHVRALNTQFASWVQLQLQNHPDELWEDGVQDYISHASHIMEKFKDVVDWLRANTTKSRSISTVQSCSDQDKLVAVSENNKPRFYADINNGFAQQSTSASFPSLHNTTSSFSSQPAGLFSNSERSGLFSSSQRSDFFSSYQAPTFTETQSSTSPNIEASGDMDEENGLEMPSSPSLKKTKEKGIVVVHEAKCKVYVKSDKPSDKCWKDMGQGQLFIKCKEGEDKASRESKPTIVVRNEAGKILLNALIYPGIKMNIQNKTITSIFHTTGGGNTNGNEADNNGIAVPRTYLLRLKNEEDTTKLATTIQEYAPSA